MSGYEFGPEELRAVHHEWTTLLRHLQQDMELGVKLINTLAPGHEPASETIAATVQASGNEFESHSRSMQDYVQAFITKLAEVGAEYLREEDSGEGRFSSGELA